MLVIDQTDYKSISAALRIETIEKGESKGRRGVPGQLLKRSPSRGVENEDDAARAVGGGVAGNELETASNSKDGSRGGGDNGLVEFSITGK